MGSDFGIAADAGAGCGWVRKFENSLAERAAKEAGGTTGLIVGDLRGAGSGELSALSLAICSSLACSDSRRFFSRIAS